MNIIRNQGNLKLLQNLYNKSKIEILNLIHVNN